MKTWAAFLLCCSFGPLLGQDYVEYQRLINRIDSNILSDDLPDASLRLDTLSQNYSFIYARHCIKGLQVSCVQNDFVRADRWLQRCFLQGVPLWVVRGNGITSAVFSNPETAATIARYDSLHAIYDARRNKPLAKTIDSLYAIDQRKTGRVNNGFFLFRHTLFGLQWLRNNRKEFLVLQSIIKQQGFPGERLIGLPAYLQDSAQGYKYLMKEGPAVMDQRTYVMLLHYYSSPRRGINDLLLPGVKAGYLPPDYFGAINDFRATWGKGRYDRSAFYNVWHIDPEPGNAAAIDARRQSIGLPGLSEQARIRAAYLERRRNRSQNSTVILE